MNRFRKLAILALFAVCFAGFACSSNNGANGGDGGGDGNGDGNGNGGGNTGEPLPPVVFTPVGSDTIAQDLIDVEFIPGGNGESIAISKSGEVFYLKNDF